MSASHSRARSALCERACDATANPDYRFPRSGEIPNSKGGASLGSSSRTARSDQCTWGEVVGGTLAVDNEGTDLVRAIDAALEEGAPAVSGGRALAGNDQSVDGDSGVRGWDSPIGVSAQRAPWRPLLADGTDSPVGPYRDSQKARFGRGCPHAGRIHSTCLCLIWISA